MYDEFGAIKGVISQRLELALNRVKENGRYIEICERQQKTEEMTGKI